MTQATAPAGVAPSSKAGAAPVCPPAPAVQAEPASFSLPAGAVDTHAHVIGGPSEHPWVADRAYTPPPATAEAYLAMLDGVGLARGVLVQVSVHGFDNRLLLETLAAQPGRLRGVVVPALGLGDAAYQAMKDVGTVGLRINTLSGAGGCRLDRLAEYGALARDWGWHIQFLLDARGLPDIAAAIDRLPVPVVVDHLGHLPTAEGIDSAGFRRLLALVRDGAWVKLSGAYRLSAEAAPPYADTGAYARALVAAAPDRCVWGSDWPHVALWQPMPTVGQLLDVLATWVPDAAVRDRILTDNPQRLYGFARGDRSAASSLPTVSVPQRRTPMTESAPTPVAPSGVSAAPPRLRGVLAPVVTPFHANFDVDTAAFIDHCRWLVASGAGLAIFGTNSEANSLSVGERLALTDALLDAGVPAASMMPGTGTCALPDTVLLTRHAVHAGAAGALMLPPFFYKNLVEDGLFAYYSEVIERVGDARLALYLYHIPAFSGVPITLTLIERLLKRYPGTLAGVKDSSGDWGNTEAMLKQFAGEGLAIFPASEALLSRALPLGAGGCISATANVNPKAIAELCRRWQDDDAPALQADVSAIRTIFQALPMIPAMKLAMAQWLGKPGWQTVRPPLTELDEGAGRRLIEQLTAAGFAMPGATRQTAAAIA